MRRSLRHMRSQFTPRSRSHGTPRCPTLLSMVSPDRFETFHMGSEVIANGSWRLKPVISMAVEIVYSDGYLHFS